jgi:hypothetical protein
VRFRTAFLLIPGLAFATACDFGATDSGSTEPGPSANQLSELARAFTDDLESETNTLTLTLPGAPMGIDFAGSCPDSSNTTDADADGVLDGAVLIYTGAACRQTIWRGGEIAVTGQVEVTDPSQASNSGYALHFTNLAWTYTNPTESRSYSATRNGRRTRIGSADSIEVESVDTTDRTRPVISAVAHIYKDLIWSFGADDAATIAIDQPLPDGRLAVEGDWTWLRSSESWDLSVRTVTRLRYDAACEAPQRFIAGRLRLTGRVDGSDGYVELTFTGCGEEPARRWVRD